MTDTMLSGTRPEEARRLAQALRDTLPPPDQWRPGDLVRGEWNTEAGAWAWFRCRPEDGAFLADTLTGSRIPAYEPEAIKGVVRIEDVEAESVSWLWPGRIPRGKIAILDGDPGLGKSTLTMDLVARVSRGMVMPDGAEGVGPSASILLGAEDGLADTIRPRLEAAGADLTLVHAMTDPLPVIPRDLVRIEDAIVRLKAAFLVVDPLMAFLDGDVNSHRDQDVRRALAPLATLADRTSVAVLLVRHLNKASGGSAIYRGGGSIGISGAARSVLLVAPDPDGDERAVMSVVKSNLAPLAPSMTYRLVPESDHGCARVRWEGTTHHNAADLLAPREQDHDRGARNDAEDFLAMVLADGPMQPKQVKRMARDEGISERTLERAKSGIGVVTRREGFGPGSKLLWGLPDHSAPPNPIARQSQSVAGYGESGALWGDGPPDEALLDVPVEADHPRSAWDVGP